MRFFQSLTLIILLLYFKNSLGIENNYIKIKKIEPEYKKHCPMSFKKDTYFYVSEGVYYNTIFELLKKESRLSYGDSLIYISKISYSTPKKNKKQILYYIQEEAAIFFEKNLYTSSGDNALKYLKKRGLKEQNIKDYRIGWAIENDYAISIHLQDMGYDIKTLREAGLVTRFNEDNPVDTFKNRITIPVYDLKGRVIGFSARSINSNKKPKYINSTRNKIHDAKKIFFNQFHALDDIRRTKSVIVFEGDFDSLIAYFNDIKNTVSIMGIEVSKEQIDWLFKEADNVYICLDSDDPGIKATRRLVDKILPYLKNGKNVFFIQLPKNIDADEFILKYGKNEFNKLVNQALSLKEYFILHDKQSMKSVSKKIPDKKLRREFIK